MRRFVIDYEAALAFLAHRFKRCEMGALGKSIPNQNVSGNVYSTKETVMKEARVPLTITLLSLALLVLAFSGTNFITAPIWVVFQKAAGLETAKTVSEIAALVATACLFVTAVLIAIPTALQPGGWLRKSLNVLPAYLLGLTFAAVIANLLGIATLGSIFSAQGPMKVSLATALLGVSAVSSTIAVVIAAARANLGNKILRAATMVTGIALVPSLILCLAVLGSINIVSTNQSGQPPVGGPPTPPIGPGNAGGLGDLVTQFEIGGGLMMAFAVIALVSFGLGLHASRGSAATTSAAIAPATRIDFRREAMRAIVSGGVVTVVIFVAIQLVPVSRDNPPVQGAVQWDSPETKDLVSRACMNCHSNETVWPWYAYFAPGSWITAVHVNSARQQFNFSELDKMSATRKRRLASDMVDQIRNGVMPPFDYQLLHPEARLSPTEREKLIQGLQNSLK